VNYDPDNGTYPESGPVTKYSYDDPDNTVTVTQVMGLDDESHPSDTDEDLATVYSYDRLNRLHMLENPNGEVTTYEYDETSNRTSLTDPVGNETTWIYDNLDRVKTESVEIDNEPLTRAYEYDANGNLTQKIDRNGRVTIYDYDNLNRRTAENWYDDEEVFQRTIGYEYDDAGNLTEVSDPDATYDYTYDNLNRQIGVTQSIAGLTPSIHLDRLLDGNGRATSLSAAIGSAADYRNTYTYDKQGRLVTLTQASQTGGQAVASKRVDLSYEPGGQLAGIARWASTTQTSAVADSVYAYDTIGRLTSITHTGLHTADTQTGQNYF